jgi:hypothetical protein
MLRVGRRAYFAGRILLEALKSCAPGWCDSGRELFMLSAQGAERNSTTNKEKKSMDFDRITPKDIISGAFYSDGPKEASGSDRMSAVAKKQIQAQIQAQHPGAELQEVNPNEIDHPAKAALLFNLGMSWATNAMGFFDLNELVTPDEKATFEKVNKTMHTTFTAIIKRLHDRHVAENHEGCTCKDDADENKEGEKES